MNIPWIYSSNPIHSFAAGDMVPIIVFVLIFAIALAKVGDVNRPIVSFFESVLPQQ
ncbi:MAG: cation:dicarboxylate symporter family transporter [Candidatus Gastranaerophilaceae bacterium]